VGSEAQGRDRLCNWLFPYDIFSASLPLTPRLMACAVTTNTRTEVTCKVYRSCSIIRMSPHVKPPTRFQNETRIMISIIPWDIQVMRNATLCSLMYLYQYYGSICSSVFMVFQFSSIHFLFTCKLNSPNAN
jgi:hypothetical protein